MDRKEEIVYATLKLAAEKGLGTVSMQQIADKVGITKASLYNHFSSRDEIVDALYTTIRDASKERASIGVVDYDKLTSKGTMKEILSTAVLSYKGVIQDPQMFQFYKIIMSERAINPNASEIMVRETRTMTDATEKLFLSMQKRGLSDFKDIKSAAFSFAMGIHSILDYGFDLRTAGMESDDSMIDGYIEEFCRIYSGGGE